MFTKILVPTDGSPAALRAARSVAALVAGGCEPKVQVTVALAVALTDPAKTDLDPEIVRDQNERMRCRAEEAVKKTGAEFTRIGLPFTTCILEGDPASAAIAQEAESGGYDLIAMGSRGMGMQKDDQHYVGSVTERVLRRVSIPVLVIPVHPE